MNLMFNYFGSKYSMSKHYGAPSLSPVIEPFAGSAAYSLYWDVEEVILIEKDPMIYGIWNFLINEATPEYIMSLDADLIDLEDCEYPPAMRDLIGFWFGRGNAWPSRRLAPKNLLNKSGHRKASYWGEQVKQRIARQLPKIKRWQVIEGDYSDAPDIEAFWLVDPPYFKQGKHYNYNNSSIDYEHLAEWCLNRRGAGLVCEAEGASWLPFEPLRNIQTQRNDSRKEYVYWLNKKADYSDLFE